MKNNLRVDDKVKVHLFDTNNKEIKTRNFDKIFAVYKKNGKMGIDWNTEQRSYTCKGDIFTPFETFATTVIFENVETGEKFHFNNIKKSVINVEL